MSKNDIKSNNEIYELLIDLKQDFKVFKSRQNTINAIITFLGAGSATTVFVVAQHLFKKIV